MKISPQSCIIISCMKVVSCDLTIFFDESSYTLVIFFIITQILKICAIFFPLILEQKLISRFLVPRSISPQTRIRKGLSGDFEKLGTWNSYGGECRGTHPPLNLTAKFRPLRKVNDT